MSDVTVKISALPSNLPWAEGVDYTVVAGIPAAGDMVRLRPAIGGERFYRMPEDVPAATPVPMVLPSADWKEYAYGVLGALIVPAGTDQQKLMAGLARYGAIIKGARASTSDGVVGALDQYDDASNFRKDKVELFLGVLVTAGIVTGDEYDAISNSWPTA
jgi:hypothetical protein